MNPKTQLLQEGIFHLIGENHLLLDEIKRAFNGRKLGLVITPERSSGCSHDDYNGDETIYIGISIIDNIYLLCHEILHGCNDLEYEVYQGFFDINCPDNLFSFIDCSVAPMDENHVSNILETSKFLKDNCYSKTDIVSLFAIAYSLYHEIGHALFDKKYDIQIKREKHADEYAFWCLKSICDSSNDDVVVRYRQKGFLAGIAMMLFAQDYDEQKKDKDHPYTIERIYNYLRFIQADDNSELWKIAYGYIQQWVEKYNINVEWQNPSLSTYAEKVREYNDHLEELFA